MDAGVLRWGDGHSASEVEVVSEALRLQFPPARGGGDRSAGLDRLGRVLPERILR